MGAFFVVVVVVVSVRCVCVFFYCCSPIATPNKRERKRRVEEKEIWIFDFISPARRFLGGL